VSWRGGRAYKCNCGANRRISLCLLLQALTEGWKRDSEKLCRGLSALNSLGTSTGYVSADEEHYTTDAGKCKRSLLLTIRSVIDNVAVNTGLVRMSPRTEQQWAEMRLNASEKIISAALEVFKQRGFHRASMEEIAKQAEVSKGLAYNYFRSKEHLLAAVMERRFNEAEGLIQGIEERSGALNKLATILDRLFDAVKKDTMLYKFYLTVFLQPDAPAAIRRIGNTSEKIRSQWAKIFEVHRAIFSELGVADPEAEVIYFRSLTTGIVAEYVMEPKNYPLEKMKAHVLHMYGMKKGGGD